MPRNSLYLAIFIFVSYTSYGFRTACVASSGCATLPMDGDLDTELNHLSEDLQAELEEASESSDIEVIEIREDEDESPLSSQPGTSSDPPPPISAKPTGLSRFKSMRCPICLETPQIVAVAPCGHPYCHECIFTALSSMSHANRKEGRCSLCRKQVRYDQVIYMEIKVGDKRTLEPPTKRHKSTD